jgi:cytochrome c
MVRTPFTKKAHERGDWSRVYTLKPIGGSGYIPAQPHCKGSRDMFDTMTITKAVGAGCGALLIFLFGSWAANSIYGTPEHHGEEEHAQAYAVEVPEAEPAAGEAAEEGPPFAEVLAAADAAAGEKVFGKCKTCHKIDGANGTGPHLNGIVGRARASIEGFGYSDGMAALAGEAWSPEHLNEFLTNPKVYVAGTKMNFAGLAKVEDRANLIAYLATTSE